jgi:hypothetical protein
MFRSPVVVVVLAGVVVLAVVLAGRSPAAAAVSCDRSATPSTFAAQVSAATAGQTICLAGGSYGTWSGTNKAITVIAADGAAPTMQVSFGSGDAGFTLDGMRGMGGAVSGGSDITIRNSTFTSSIDFSGTGISGVVLDGNSLAWNSTGVCCKISVNNTNGTVADPAVTLRNNDIRNGESDGVQVREGAKGLVILNNTFANLCDIGANHTDNIQHYGSGITQNRIAGNYFLASAGCNTQGITSYDGGTDGVIIEDNVLDIRRPWAIELYADKNSIVRHNTLRWYAAGNCAFNIACGQIDINRKSGDAAGSGTQVYDNLTTGANFSNGSTGTQHHNISAQQASYVGPLTSYAGFKLASNSPVGRNAASDGLDAGARITTTPNPPRPPPPPPRRCHPVSDEQRSNDKHRM